MMTWKFRIGFILLLLVCLSLIVNQIRKRSLELKYALAWIVVTCGLIVIALVPGLLDAIALMIGVYDPVNLVFFLGFLFSIVIIYILTIMISKNADRLRKMAQRMALNEYRLKK